MAIWVRNVAAWMSPRLVEMGRTISRRRMAPIAVRIVR
jgi:hypothetical protein